MKQYVVETKIGPGRWDGWGECGTFYTRQDADAFASQLSESLRRHGVRVREQVVL